jgi:glycosyltransferase involved in cell wall biosynthesis
MVDSGAPVKILTYTSLFPNAAKPNLGIFIYQRAAHLAARPGNAVQVIAPVPYAPRWMGGRWGGFGHIQDVEQIRGLTVHHPRYPLLPKVSMPLHARLMARGTVQLVEQLHREMKFDCIDAHFVYPDGCAAVHIGQKLGLPVVVSARGTDINVFPEFRFIRPQIRWTLENAAGAIAVSRTLEGRMLELGLERAKSRVIGNGVDPARFFPVDRQQARERLGLARKASIVVSVGALLPVKGHDRLLEALAQARRELPDLLLYVIGEGDFRGALERKRDALGLRGSAFFPGSCPNETLRDWYSAADVSCLASAREGWANVLLESLACGTPVVATRVGGTPEVMASPELGVLVEPDTASLAAGLREALGRTWHRDHLVAYARKREWSVVAAEVEEFVSQCIARTRRGAQGAQQAAAEGPGAGS